MTFALFYRIAFAALALFAGAIAHAQPVLTRLSSHDYQPFQKEDYEYSDGAVKLGGKYYYVTLAPTETRKGRKQKEITGLTETGRVWTLYETDGTPNGTRVAVRNKDGFYNLGATRDALLYYTYTPLWGELHQYRPATGDKMVCSRYKLNAYMRTTRLFTDPGRADAMLFHFEQDTYYLLRIDAGGAVSVVKTSTYVEPSRLKGLNFNIQEKPVWNDSEVLITNRLKRKNGTYGIGVVNFSVTGSRPQYGFYCTSFDERYKTLLGSFFPVTGTTGGILNFEDNPKTGKKDLGILVNKGSEYDFFNLNAPKLANKLLRTEIKGDKYVAILSADYTGLLFRKSEPVKLRNLNKGLPSRDFFNNSEQTLLTDEWLFFTSGDTLIYQRYEGRDWNDPQVGIKTLVLARQTTFPDQNPKFVDTRGVTTRKYFYCIGADKRLYRLDPAKDNGRLTAIELPPDTEVLEWRMLQACDDMVLVGGLVKGSRKQDSYQVFALRDTDQ